MDVLYLCEKTLERDFDLNQRLFFFHGLGYSDLQTDTSVQDKMARPRLWFAYNHKWPLKTMQG